MTLPSDFDFDRPFFYENGFYLTSDITRIGKLVAHFLLYQKIVRMPGAVVECGVFKGTSLIRWATFRELLESPFSRKIIGFDAFGPFPEVDNDADKAWVQKWEASAGDGISRESMAAVMDHKGIRNVELVSGDIRQTLPEYLGRNAQLRIALLHIDVDVYAPSKAGLELLYDRVVPGDIVVLDDYGMVQGETRAVDEFLAGRNIQLEKEPINHIPTFFRKP